MFEYNSREDYLSLGVAWVFVTSFFIDSPTSPAPPNDYLLIFRLISFLGSDPGHMRPSSNSSGTDPAAKEVNV
jgi:hypothetical protein